MLIPSKMWLQHCSMTYSQKRERSKYRNHKVRLCVLCVCVKNSASLPPLVMPCLNCIIYCLFSNQMKWKKIERYTQRKVWHTINLSFSLCLHNHEIIITSHSSEHFATFSSPNCYILLPPQVWDGSVVTVRSSTTPWCQDVNHVTSPRSTAGRELSSHELGHFDFVMVFVVCVLFMN